MAGSGPGGGSRDGHILMKLGNIRDELDRLNRQQKTTVEKAQKLVYSEKDIQRARHAALTEAMTLAEKEECICMPETQWTVPGHKFAHSDRNCPRSHADRYAWRIKQLRDGGVE